MSFIKTMKAQTQEYKGSVPAWPDDFPLASLFPLTEATGAPSQDLIDAISGLPLTLSLFTNNANNTATGTQVIADTGNGKEPATNSYIWFYVGDTHATNPVANINSAAASSFSLNVQAGVGIGYRDAAGSQQQLSTTRFTPSAVNQLIMVVCDRDANTVSFYEGANGTTLIHTYNLTAGNSFNAINTLTTMAMVNCYGFGHLVFEKGLPDNWLAIMQHIATELRAGRKHAFLNTLVQDYLL